jgi:hypothetical protein
MADGFSFDGYYSEECCHIERGVSGASQDGRRSRAEVVLFGRRFFVNRLSGKRSVNPSCMFPRRKSLVGADTALPSSVLECY